MHYGWVAKLCAFNLVAYDEGSNNIGPSRCKSSGYIHIPIPGPYVVVLFMGAGKALFSIELILLIWVMQCFLIAEVHAIKMNRIF